MSLYGTINGAVVALLLILLPAQCLAGENILLGQNEWIRKGELEAGRANWSAAARQFYKAISEDENNALAFYDLGIAYLHLGDINKAKIAEEQALSLKPDFVNAYIQLATILVQSDDKSAAEKALRKALEIEPNNQTVQINLAALLAKPKPAEVSVSPPPSALEPSGNLKTQDSSANQQDNKAVSSAAQESDRVRKSEEILIRKVRSNKAMKEDAEICLEEAVAACCNEQMDAAKGQLTRVIAEDPSISSAYASLGAILGLEGDYEAEIAKEKIAIELDELNPVAHSNLAWALAQKKRWSEALKESQRALELEPGLTEAEIIKALSQSEVGDRNEAKEVLRKIIAADNSALLPRLAMSVILEQEGSIEASKTELDETIKLNPESQILKQWQALTELKRENWLTAQSLYKQIVKDSPCKAQAWLGLGLALDKLGEPLHALDAFQKAVQLSPNCAAAHMAYGLALEKRGSSAEAAAQLKEAFRLNPAYRLAEANGQKEATTTK